MVLVENISSPPRQKAINAPLSDRSGERYTFNVSSHGAGSSSILPFEQHAEIIPEVKYIEQIELVSTTFGDLVRERSIDLSKYGALLIDAEGAEMLILSGAHEFLSDFRYIQCEVSDFPSRTGAPTSADLDGVLGPLGFNQMVRHAFAYGVEGNGTYWNIVWKKTKAADDHDGLAPMIINHTWDRVGV